MQWFAHHLNIYLFKKPYKDNISDVEAEKFDIWKLIDLIVWKKAAHSEFDASNKKNVATGEEK